eukprot:682733-Ditylum_brightwellii.AAC.1
MVELNLLPGSPVSLQDATYAEFLFGPDLGALKGKMTCKIPPSVRTDYINVPQALINLHKHVTITVDVMFINKIPFLISVSRSIKFTTAQMLNNRKKSSLLTTI